MHGCSSLVFVVCYVGSGLCDELITCSEISTGYVHLSVCELDTSTIKLPRLD